MQKQPDLIIERTGASLIRRGRQLSMRRVLAGGAGLGHSGVDVEFVVLSLDNALADVDGVAQQSEQFGVVLKHDQSPCERPQVRFAMLRTGRSRTR